MVNENGLTIKQQKFVDNYLTSGNITESAIKAGYSPKNANQSGNILLKNQRILTVIHTRMKQLESEKIAQQKEVLEFLTAIIRNELTEEMVMNIGKGRGVTAAEKILVKISAKDRIKAAELLAKIQGFLLNRSEVDVKSAVPVIIKDDI